MRHVHIIALLTVLVVTGFGIYFLSDSRAATPFLALEPENGTNRSFSYMKNRWVKMWFGSKVCYGQIEDAGPADNVNGNGNYADYPYVFGTNDARPFNKSYGGAGADVSPALGSCMGMSFDGSITLNWQFLDDANIPAGPWKTIVKTSQLTSRIKEAYAYGRTTDAPLAVNVSGVPRKLAGTSAIVS